MTPKDELNQNGSYGKLRRSPSYLYLVLTQVHIDRFDLASLSNRGVVYGANV